MLGSNVFQECGAIFVIKATGEKVLSIEPPDEVDGPYLLSAVFKDLDGNDIGRIDRNVWWSRTDTFDVEYEGPRCTARTAPGKIALVLKTLPPSAIAIERVYMPVCRRQRFSAVI
jgi:hypothetical protein